MQTKRNCFLKKILGIIFLCFVFGCEKENNSLGNGYELLADEGGYNVSICDSMNTQKIEAYILECKFDHNFIIAIQSPLDSLPPMKKIIYTDSNRREILSNDKVFRQYWIINKREKEVYSYDSLKQKAKYSNIYGPYNKSEYLKQRQILKVPEKLKLEN